MPHKVEKLNWNPQNPCKARSSSKLPISQHSYGEMGGETRDSSDSHRPARLVYLVKNNKETLIQTK